MQGQIPSLVDVIVIGAGLSGLTAAVDIQRAGLSCLVLEANNRVGGKTCSIQSTGSSRSTVRVKGPPGTVDIGGAWINDTSQSHMHALAKKYKLDLKIQPVTGKKLLQTSDAKVIPNDNENPPFSPEDGEKVMQLIGTLNELVDSSDLEDPSSGPDAEALDKVTLEEFCASHSDSEAAIWTIKTLTQGLLGVEPKEISTLFFINYCKSGTGIENLASDYKDGGQYIRVRQGTMSVSEGLASELQPETLLLSKPVTKISQTDSGCQVVVGDGEATLECKRVIVSVPTPLYSLIEFEPSLPEAKLQLAGSTALGYYSKMIFVYRSAWWREANLSGAFESEIGPVAFSRDTTVEEDDQFSITCFIVGDAGRKWSASSAISRKQQIVSQFQAIFGSVVAQIPEPINVIEMEWVKQPWARGAPSPVMAPGVLTSDAGRSLRTPWKNIHFVGTETSVIWKGYMEGAVRSGIRGAKEAIACLA